MPNSSSSPSLYRPVSYHKQTGSLVLTKENARQLMGGEVQGDFARKLKEAEQYWGQATQPEALEAAIQAWEEAITIETPGLDDETRRAKLFEVYVRLSRAYYLLGDTVLWLSIEDPAQQDAQVSAALIKGRAHAERALGLYSPAFFDAIQQGDTMVKVTITD